MFATDDLLQVLGGNHETKMVRDRVVGDVANITYNDIESLQNLFPNETFSDTQSVAYVASKMCHSYPKVNARKRTFFPKVMANSAESARDNFVNIDHQVSDNGMGKEELVIGHIKAASFPWKETAEMPEEPLPMYALTALYLRMPVVREILTEARTKKNWLTSMECGHDIRKAGFLYEGEYIPMDDAPSAMRECVKANTVLPYRGKELAFCLGGKDGSVDFWGYAATESPADSGASIMGIATYAREVFNKKDGTKKKFFGFHWKNYVVPEKTAEAANMAVDIKMNEQASIAVIGQTDPAEDGHAHDVLSDGTIVPYEGHTHYVACYNLTRGTSPSYSGRTEAYTMYVNCDSCGQCDPCRCSPRQEPKVHMHLINISLKGKLAGAKTDDPLVPDVSNFSKEDLMNLQEIANAMTRMEKFLSTGKVGDAANTPNAELVKEFASLKEALAKSSLDLTIKDAVEKEVASRIASGVVLTKEKADEAVAAAVKEATDKAAALAKETEARQRRRDELTAMGISLDSTEYEPASGKSIKDFIDSIPIDGIGEQLFSAEMRAFKALKAAEDAKKVVPAATVIPVEKPADKIGVEAANSGKKGIFSIVGAANPTETKAKEAANVSKVDGKAKLFANLRK